jgi:hypothetical protein
MTPVRADANGTSAPAIALQTTPISLHSYTKQNGHQNKYSCDLIPIYTFEETSIVERSQLRDMDHQKDIKMSVLATLLQEDSPLPSESTASTF